MSEVLWPLPEAGRGRSAGAALQARRADILALAASQLHEPGIATTACRIAGTDGIVASGAADRATILYLHGGGFRIGGVAVWTGLASRLSAAAAARVVLPEYPLAPERPFPAALDALVTLADAVADPERPLILAGDSAGGNLAVALALTLAASGRPAPRALLLFSPWLDLTLGGASLDACAAADPLFSRAAAIEARDMYLAGAPPGQPLASPLFAAADEVPPVWLCASGSEVLRDDALRFATRLAERGRCVELLVEPDLPHVWPIMQPAGARTAATIESAGRFARRWTGSDQAKV